MGLSIGGELQAARKAYRWLAKLQLADGSWWASYRGEEVDNPQRRESNFVAYVATGLWHYYLISGERDFLQDMWPTVDGPLALCCPCRPRTGKFTGPSMLRVTPRKMPW